MNLQVGEEYKTTCLETGCSGSIQGTFGGKFFVGERQIEYTQIRNCKCDTCSFEKEEVFEVWDEYNDEFWVSKFVTIPISDDSDISFPGLGKLVAELTPEMEYFLKTGNR